MRHPGEMKLSEFHQISAYRRWLRGFYLGDRGVVERSSREHPAPFSMPVGTWRIDDQVNGAYGHMIEELIVIPVEMLTPTEETTGGKMADVDRYAGWKHQAPPIEVLYGDTGKFLILDGHRRWLSAKKRGDRGVLAWVSWSMGTGKMDYEGREIPTSLTFERRADWKRPVVPGVTGGLGGSKVSRSWTESPGVFWHGTATGKLGGGSRGIHIGTYRAATQALEATIGIPATGTWDGTRKYGNTLLAGKSVIPTMVDKYITGHNCHAPSDNYYPRDTKKPATFSNGDPIPMNAKPNIIRVAIINPSETMTNSTFRPMTDTRANAIIKRQLKQGNARRGYFYINNGEDCGSISAVVPDASFLERLSPKS